MQASGSRQPGITTHTAKNKKANEKMEQDWHKN
jgi:hypothetical protein